VAYVLSHVVSGWLQWLMFCLIWLAVGYSGLRSASSGLRLITVAYVLSHMVSGWLQWLMFCHMWLAVGYRGLCSVTCG